MTEAQRIIKSGLLPSNFLDEEVRCEYLVTTQMKKIWAIELDILVEFDRVCKKHGLRYFLMCGTLLGAIRHKGFIPWDDDIDVAMPRDDFNKLNTLQDEFRHPIFLQTPLTDKDFGGSHTCIRNTNTSAISPIIRFQKMNHGLFIDVFALDHFVPEGAEERFAEINRLNIENGTFMRLTNPHLNEKNRERVKAYNRDHIADYRKIHEIASMFNDRETDKLAILTWTAEPLERNVWDAKDFSGSVDVEFEGFRFPAPAGYINILTQMFGNYMEFPPVEQRGAQHSQYVLDPDTPYEEFLKTATF